MHHVIQGALDVVGASFENERLGVLLNLEQSEEIFAFDFFKFSFVL